MKDYVSREALIALARPGTFATSCDGADRQEDAVPVRVIQGVPAAGVVEMRRLTGYDEGLIKDLEWYCRDHRHPKWTRELVKRAAESIAGKNELRGRWETYKSGEHTECICSACKKSYYYHNKGQYQINKSCYCPNCGAKMTEV